MKMKMLLLFMVTIMIFFLYLVPIIWPFSGNPIFIDGAIAAGYVGWYVMTFVLTMCWGSVVSKNGCWFFQK